MFFHFLTIFPQYFEFHGVYKHLKDEGRILRTIWHENTHSYWLVCPLLIIESSKIELCMLKDAYFQDFSTSVEFESVFTVKKPKFGFSGKWKTLIFLSQS